MRTGWDERLVLGTDQAGIGVIKDTTGRRARLWSLD